MINPSLIESSIFFFQSKLAIYYIGFFFQSSDQKISGKNIKDTNDADVNNAPCCPTPNTLRPKNITAAVEVTVLISNPSPEVIGSLLAVAATVASSSSMFS